MTTDNRPHLLKRFVLAALVIVLASAAATAVVGFSALSSLTGLFGAHLDLAGKLHQAPSGAPQTILVIGSDRNSGIPGSDSLADTMMLVRIDPSQHVTMTWSLPRDLAVDIPGHGLDKLNAAYGFGGDALALEMVTQVTGLQINHVIDVNYAGFRRAVDQVGCTYTDVDQRYFNDNSQNAPRSTYAAINLEPGYQKLCGSQALDYVRYRHTDTDIVRGYRQQSFIRDAEAQVGTSGLIANEPALAKIFGQETISDLSSQTDVLRLLNEALAARQYPVRAVAFEGTLGPSFVYASAQQLGDMQQRFLNGGHPQTAAAPPAQGQAQAASKPAITPIQNATPQAPPPNLVDASSAGLAEAAQAHATGAPLAVYYPTTLATGSRFEGAPHTYTIQGPDGRSYPSYRVVVASGEPGEYYGLQGTTWQDPPILHLPSVQQTIGGRSYQLFYAGNGLALVAWRDRGAVYWLANSLSQKLTEQQMLAIASSARPL